MFSLEDITFSSRTFLLISAFIYDFLNITSSNNISKVANNIGPIELIKIILNGDFPADLRTFKLPSWWEIANAIMTPNKQAPSTKSISLCGIDWKT